MLRAVLQNFRCIHSLCTSHYVTCDVSHDTLVLFGQGAQGHMLQCIYVLMSPHAFGKCHYYPGRYEVRPIGMRPFCADQDAGRFSPLFTQTEDSSTLRQPDSSFSAPVTSLFALCLVLWTTTCLCLIALFKRASTHILRVFYSADIGIPLTQPRFQLYMRCACALGRPTGLSASI